MKKHIFSIVLFVLALVWVLFLGLLGDSWLLGLALGGVFLLAGLVFYRRGK